MKRTGIRLSMVIYGLLIVAAGVLLALFNSGALPAEYKDIVFSWQTLLISIGFASLFSRHSAFMGIVLILIGGFFILPKFDYPRFTFVKENFWTILLITGGVMIILKGIFLPRLMHRTQEGIKHRHGRYVHKGTSSQTETIEMNYIFSGGKDRIDIEGFRGGEINCVFGGGEIDLRGSTLAEGGNILQINSVFGGMTIYVPEEWRVEVRQNSIFGRFNDSRRIDPAQDMTRMLIIEATSVFGGGELK